MFDDIKMPHKNPNKFGAKSAMRSLRLQSVKRPVNTATTVSSSAETLQTPSEYYSASLPLGGSAAHHIPVYTVPVNLPKKSKFKINLTQKQIIILGAVAGILITGGTIFALTRPKPQPEPTKKPEIVEKNESIVEAAKPIIIKSPLSGAAVQSGEETRPVTAIMIENSPEARPQSGLLQASIVFEAIAEGGITRFVALYQEGQPQYIGPVRSVRPYYLDFLAPFNASVAHVGGSKDALDQVRSGSFRDIDQFFNDNAYWRITGRYAPHNVYTSFEKLNALNNAKGYKTSAFTSWTRKEDAKSAAPTAKSIDLSISGFTYNPHYEFDAATNTYKRSEAGKPHIDEKSSAQLSPKVVIAMVMKNRVINSSDGYRTEYDSSGTGEMFVFQDGIATKGTWSKPERNKQFTFADSAGNPLSLNAGQTWVTMVSDPLSVSYK